MNTVQEMKRRGLTEDDLRCPPEFGGCGQSWPMHTHPDYVHCLACGWKGTIDQAAGMPSCPVCGEQVNIDGDGGFECPACGYSWSCLWRI